MFSSVGNQMHILKYIDLMFMIRTANRWCDPVVFCKDATKLHWQIITNAFAALKKGTHLLPKYTTIYSNFYLTANSDDLYEKWISWTITTCITNYIDLQKKLKLKKISHNIIAVAPKFICIKNDLKIKVLKVQIDGGIISEKK